MNPIIKKFNLPGSKITQLSGSRLLNSDQQIFEQFELDFPIMKNEYIPHNDKKSHKGSQKRDQSSI